MYRAYTRAWFILIPVPIDRSRSRHSDWNATYHEKGIVTPFALVCLYLFVTDVHGVLSFPDRVGSA
jgi:hypothetical protein